MDPPGQTLEIQTYQVNGRHLSVKATAPPIQDAADHQHVFALFVNDKRMRVAFESRKAEFAVDADEEVRSFRVVTYRTEADDGYTYLTDSCLIPQKDWPRGAFERKTLVCARLDVPSDLASAAREVQSRALQTIATSTYLRFVPSTSPDCYDPNSNIITVTMSIAPDVTNASVGAFGIFLEFAPAGKSSPSIRVSASERVKGPLDKTLMTRLASIVTKKFIAQDLQTAR